MKAPRYIAVFACMLLAFVIFQSWMWQWHQPGWQPSWWQLFWAAKWGFILSVCAAVAAGPFVAIGITNPIIVWTAIALGFVVEFVVTYILAHSVATGLFKHFYGSRQHKTVA